MENKSNKKAWIVLGIAALGLLGFFIWINDGFQRHDWRMNLEEESKEPYGLHIVRTMVEQSIAKDSFLVLEEKLAESLPLNTDATSNFVFIGEAMLLDTTDMDQLLDFIAEGNTAFISSSTIPNYFMKTIFDSPCYDIEWIDYDRYYDTAVITNFLHPDLKASTYFSFPYVRANQVYNTYWEKMDESIFCDADDDYPTIISQSPDSIVDMVLFPYGEGACYLQTSPIAFTNYSLTQSQGQDYTEKVFAHLTTGPIYWDSFSNVPTSIGRGGNGYSNYLDPREGPLDYVLSQPPLAWAWYLLLSLALLYLLFRAKRRQRVIPVLEKNRNTSLEFINTISRLHFTGDNHYRIALHKMELLENFIRSKYRLSFTETKATFTKQLSQSSEIDEAIIKKIFLLYTNIKSSIFTTDKTLIELHKLTDYFYKNCR